MFLHFSQENNININITSSTTLQTKNIPEDIKAVRKEENLELKFVHVHEFTSKLSFILFPIPKLGGFGPDMRPSNNIKINAILDKKTHLDG